MQVNRAEIFLFGFLDLATLLEGIGVGVHPHSGVVRIGCQIIPVNLGRFSGFVLVQENGRQVQPIALE